MSRTLDLTFVDIVGIRVEPLIHVQNIKNDTSHINRGSTYQELAGHLQLNHQNVKGSLNDKW